MGSWSEDVETYWEEYFDSEGSNSSSRGNEVINKSTTNGRPIEGMNNKINISINELKRIKIKN